MQTEKLTKATAYIRENLLTVLDTPILWLPAKEQCTIGNQASESASEIVQ